MRNILLIGLIILSTGTIYAQDKKIDKLELFYSQKLYSKVGKKANKLLADPEYDYSAMPSYYKALSLFRLSDNLVWYKRHNTSIANAIKLYNVMLQHQDAEHYIKAHYFEIADLKHYLKDLKSKMGSSGYNEDAKRIEKFINSELKQIKGYYKPPVENTNDSTNKPEESETVSTSSNSVREQIVAYAKTFIGVKYVWAGSDPSGFDCSGYTSYILKKYGVLLSRTASGQMAAASKIKVMNAFMGDLVFFGHSGNITHVGLVVSKKGEDLQMIHASTSKGVIITNINSSTYWKPKLKGAGKVV